MATSKKVDIDITLTDDFKYLVRKYFNLRPAARVKLSPVFWDTHTSRWCWSVVTISVGGKIRKLKPRLPVYLVRDIIQDGGTTDEWQKRFAVSLNNESLQPLETYLNALKDGRSSAYMEPGCEDCKAHKPGWIELACNWVRCDCNPE